MRIDYLKGIQNKEIVNRVFRVNEKYAKYPIYPKYPRYILQLIYAIIAYLNILIISLSSSSGIGKGGSRTRYEPVIDSLVFSGRLAGYCLGFRGEGTTILKE